MELIFLGIFIGLGLLFVGVILSKVKDDVDRIQYQADTIEHLIERDLADINDLDALEDYGIERQSIEVYKGKHGIS